MKNLFDPAMATELKQRTMRLEPTSTRQWGTMTPSQAAAHCARALETAVGDKALSRLFVGRIIGALIKPKVLGDDAPLRRNSPTDPRFVVRDDPDLPTEQRRLCALIDRFSSAGPQGCTSQPHSFFGKMKPEEWAILMYKHVDHHLRQFGV